ncbi:hypothetical protein FRC12_006405 [Ceratobasidium sp. 428]|nr:hypothetical protein FRC12_006405 [Ceratobasidium sp. 428]
MPQTRAMAAAQVAGPSSTGDPRKAAPSKSAPRKRTRTNKDVARAPKRGKPSLKRILDMPPEVFNEIAIHLMPTDLLSLARLNKFFRNIFMSRSSRHIWQAAFLSLPGLPPCPSDLSEPQYASLLFSKTCSSCGARVLRRMDPFLHVRLCNPCRDEQCVTNSDIIFRAAHKVASGLLTFENMTISSRLYLGVTVSTMVKRLVMHNSIVSTTVIKSASYGFMFTLRSEYQMVRERANGKQSFFTWRETRAKEMDEWHERADELEMYLDRIDLDRESELEELKEKRVEDIETRLVEKGWTKRDAITSPENATEWNKLVWQPKPMTDRIWNNLYPKLVPMLESNRAYHERIDKEMRQRSRIARVGSLATMIRMDLPPLVHVTLKNPPESGDASESSMPEPNAPEPNASESYASESSISDTLDLPALASGNIDVKVEMPFPSMSELLTWPMIKNIVEDDTLADAAEIGFNGIREEFNQAVVEWRNKIEQDLIDIWNAGRPGDLKNEDREDEAKPGPSTKKGKGKLVASTGIKRNTRKTKSRASGPQSSSAEASHDSVELVLPEFVVTFAKPNGTTTTDISELTPNMQTLLRADTVFRSPRLYGTYPTLVPPAALFGAFVGAFDRLSQGERWSVEAVTRDLDASTIATNFLARMGRPDATSAEMKAIGMKFKCARCIQILPLTWEELVTHYRVEQGRWKQAKVTTKGDTKSQFAFRNIHELEQPLNAKPFAHLMTAQAAATFMVENTVHEMMMMTCQPCESMGVDARYFHKFEVGMGIESPMIQHLRDVHDIEHAVFGLHFRRWFLDPDIFDTFMSDEEDYDSDDPWGWEDY